MRCGPEPEKNFSRAIEFIREAAKKDAQIVCLPEFFRSQYFCQTEDHKNFELAEEVPGRGGARDRHRDYCLTFRETQRRRLPQYRGNNRHRRRIARQISQDARPGRPAVSRKVLFRTRGPGISGMADNARQNRRLRLLGPVVPRGSTSHRAARRRDHFLSNSNRVAPIGKEKLRRGTTFRVGNDPARSRDCEWMLCRGAEPRRP